MSYWEIGSELLSSGEAVLSRISEVRRLVMAVTMTTCEKKWASHLIGDASRRMLVGGGPGVFRRGLPNRTQCRPHLPCCRSSLRSFSLLLPQGLLAALLLCLLLDPPSTWVSSALVLLSESLLLQLNGALSEAQVPCQSNGWVINNLCLLREVIVRIK